MAVGVSYLIFKEAGSKHAGQQVLKVGGLAIVFALFYLATGQFQGRYDTVVVRLARMKEEGGIGADRNFTTRVRLGAVALNYHINHPGLTATGRGLPLGNSTNWIVGDSDSAYINTLNAVGIVGLFLVLTYIRFLWMSGPDKRARSSPLGSSSFGARALILTYLTMGLAGNVFGSPFSTTIFLVSVSVYLAANLPYTRIPKPSLFASNPLTTKTIWFRTADISKLPSNSRGCE